MSEPKAEMYDEPDIGAGCSGGDVADMELDW